MLLVAVVKLRNGSSWERSSTMAPRRPRSMPRLAEAEWHQWWVITEHWSPRPLLLRRKKAMEVLKFATQVHLLLLQFLWRKLVIFLLHNNFTLGQNLFLKSQILYKPFLYYNSYDVGKYRYFLSKVKRKNDFQKRICFNL